MRGIATAMIYITLACRSSGNRGHVPTYSVVQSDAEDSKHQADGNENNFETNWVDVLHHIVSILVVAGRLFKDVVQSYIVCAAFDHRNRVGIGGFLV